MLWISVTVSVTFIIFSLCFLATSSVVFSCCFSLVFFSTFDLSSFLDSTFSLASDFLSSLGLSSKLSKASLSAFTSLSISSWLISKSSNVFSARDKIRLSFSADFSVFLLISAFLILATKSSNSFLLTSILAVDAPTVSLAVIFSILLLLELCVFFSFSSVDIAAFEFSSPTLFFSCLATVSKPLTSPAYVTCGPLTFTAPTTKNREQPKRICLPFLTIRQFFCWSPCLLNNIFFLLLSIFTLRVYNKFIIYSILYNFNTFTLI